MPVIGDPFSCGFDGRRFVTLELFRGLAQRNNGRKTSYFDGVRRRNVLRDNSATPGCVEAPTTISPPPGGEDRAAVGRRISLGVERFGSGRADVRRVIVERAARSIRQDIAQGAKRAT